MRCWKQALPSVHSVLNVHNVHLRAMLVDALGHSAHDGAVVHGGASLAGAAGQLWTVTTRAAGGSRAGSADFGRWPLLASPIL